MEAFWKTAVLWESSDPSALAGLGRFAHTLPQAPLPTKRAGFVQRRKGRNEAGQCFIKGQYDGMCFFFVCVCVFLLTVFFCRENPSTCFGKGVQAAIAFFVGGIASTCFQRVPLLGWFEGNQQETIHFWGSPLRQTQLEDFPSNLPHGGRIQVQFSYSKTNTQEHSGCTVPKDSLSWGAVFA